MRRIFSFFFPFFFLLLFQNYFDVAQTIVLSDNRYQITNYYTKNNISYSVSKISFTCLMTPTDMTNDQNAIRRLFFEDIFTY